MESWYVINKLSLMLPISLYTGLPLLFCIKYDIRNILYFVDYLWQIILVKKLHGTM